MRNLLTTPLLGPVEITSETVLFGYPLASLSFQFSFDHSNFCLIVPTFVTDLYYAINVTMAKVKSFDF